MKAERIIKNKAAFTLLEVMLAAAIVGGALVAALASLGSSAKAAKLANSSMVASDIVSDAFGQYRCGNFAVGDSGTKSIDAVQYNWQLNEQVAETHGRLIRCSVNFSVAGRQRYLHQDFFVKP